MPETMTYKVPGMTCNHCKASITRELTSVSGVSGVDIDLGTKAVTVTGEGLEDGTLRAAIAMAGYEAN